MDTVHGYLRRVPIRAALLVLVMLCGLVGCELGPNRDVPPTGSLAKGLAQRITTVDGKIANIFIDEDPSALDAYYTRISADVDENTHVYRQQGGEYVLIRLQNIVFGDKVSAYFKDAVVSSNPPGGYTYLIIIRER